MSARRIAALPVDARPVVREQVGRLMRAAGWALAVPPVELLGFLREPADRDALADWLASEAREAAGLAVSIDMLVYGGLVPSRLNAESQDALLPRLDLLRTLKAQAPDRPLYAFASTMRISNNNVAEEEKSYWSMHGEAIWQWSFTHDRAQVTGEPADRETARAAEARVPAAVRDDYLATRSRNAAVTARVLDLVEDGVIDRLILPQDDTASFGFNIAERRGWQAEVARRGLESRVCIYPGADEVLHTLCAHLTGGLEGRRPVHAALLFDDPEGARAMIARYEDRPLQDTLQGQAEAAGVALTQDLSQAEIMVLVHTRGAVQGDHAMRVRLPHGPPDAATLKRIAAWAAAGKKVAVLDCAYANGGDLPFVEALHCHVPVSRWFSYAAWNTAGNRSGNLFAHCAFAASAGPAGELVTLRLLEDALYQGHFRAAIRARVDEARVSAAELAAQVRETFVPAANRWAYHHGLEWRVDQIHLPWNRTFEIGISLERVA